MPKQAGFKKGFLTFVAVAGLCASQAFAENNTAAPAPAQENKGTLLHPKVDKPIPDTYEPLNGTRSEDRDVGTDPIRESWDMKKKQKEREHEAEAKAKADAESKNAPQLQKDIKIQEPDLGPAHSSSPRVEQGKDSIRIQDQ